MKLNLNQFNLEIQSISYHNKEIFGRIYNPELKKQANISGLERYVERSSGRPFQRKIDLKGILNEEFRIPSNGIFDMSFILSTNEDEVRDLVYIADGAWGIDNPKAAAILHKSNFLVDTRSRINETDYLIERGVELIVMFGLYIISLKINLFFKAIGL